MSIEAMKFTGPLHVVCECDKCKAEKQEPVAWSCEHPQASLEFWTTSAYDAERKAEQGYKVTPLYTHPPQRQPLTDELKTLMAISDEYNAWIKHHAAGHSYDDFLSKRTAHGITGEQHG